MARDEYLPESGFGTTIRWSDCRTDLVARSTQNAEVVGLQIPSDMGRLYAAISGDRNPIHLHPLAAKAFGFRTTIVHGMWTLARCLAEVEGELPGLTSPPRDSSSQFSSRGEHVADRSGDGKLTVWLTTEDTRHAVVHVQFRD